MKKFNNHIQEKLKELNWRKIRQKSFTLIEILIAVAIIVILGSIIAVNVGRQARMTARDAQRITDLALVQSYLELYYSRFGYYPVNLFYSEKQRPSSPDKEQSQWDNLQQQLIGANIGEILPTDPLNNNDHFYIYVSQSDLAVAEDKTKIQGYILRAKLETKSKVLDNDADNEGEHTSVWIHSGGGFIDCGDDNGNYYCVVSRCTPGPSPVIEGLSIGIGYCKR